MQQISHSLFVALLAVRDRRVSYTPGKIIPWQTLKGSNVSVRSLTVIQRRGLIQFKDGVLEVTPSGHALLDDRHIIIKRDNRRSR